MQIDIKCIKLVNNSECDVKLFIIKRKSGYAGKNPIRTMDIG